MTDTSADAVERLASGLDAGECCKAVSGIGVHPPTCTDCPRTAAATLRALLAERDALVQRVGFLSTTCGHCGTLEQAWARDKLRYWLAGKMRPLPDSETPNPFGMDDNPAEVCNALTAERDAARAALLRLVQKGNDCAATGRSCRADRQCGCVLDMREQEDGGGA